MKKHEIRDQFKKKRSKLSELEVNSLSEKSFQILISEIDFSNKHVGIFIPIKKFNEPNTLLIIPELQEKNCSIYAPRTDLDKLEMKFYPILSIENLISNPLGLSEPKGGSAIEQNKLDIILIPLLAVSDDGHRVGYGKGFYDRFLLGCRKTSKKIGISLFDETVVIEDLAPTDIALTHCATPSRLLSFG